MAQQKYSFNEYSEKYPALFRQEAERIRKFLPMATFEHIGSTAVPGLGGKTVVDVSVAVPEKDTELAMGLLQENGYLYNPNAGCPQRWFFKRVVKEDAGERLVHVHLTNPGSVPERLALSLRDYLRSHPEVCREYEQVKKEAVEFAQGDGKKYREYKEKFFANHEQKALEEYRNK